MKTKLIPLFSLALVSAAHSQTVVDIVGSTAGRSAVHAQILSLLSNETYAYDGTGAASAAARAIYTGSYNGQDYVIRTYWSGSVNGVRDVAQQIQQNQFFATTVAGTAAGQNINPATPLAGAAPATAPEIGFSDVFQTSTAFTSPVLGTEDEVGVIPFKFFKNDGATAGLTNITPALARALYGSLGSLPVYMFTDTVAPPAAGVEPRYVYATGRNADSGTRITAMAESGYGVFRQVSQYTGTVAGGVITELTESFNNGFSSGSGVSGLLAGTNADADVVGYIGASDWPAAVTGGAAEIAWNGVTLGTAAGWENKIRHGQYTFWGYLHQNRMTLTGPALSFYNALRDGLTAAPGSGIITESSMLVQRDGDGAPVFPK